MPLQERNELLAALKNEIINNGPLRLAYFGNFLDNRTRFSRNLYAGTGPKRWLQAYFPEIEIVGNNGREVLTIRSTLTAPVPDPRPIPTPVVPVELTEQTRQEFIAVLSEHLEMHGMVLHSAIPGLIPDWTKYRNNNEKLGIWLSRIFREDEFTTRLVNNAAALFLPQTAAEIDQIVKSVNEMIQPTGRASLAAIASRLVMENLRWESLPVAHNQTLDEWLVDYCPRIAYSESAGSVYLAQFAPEPHILSITDANKQKVVYQYAFLPTVGSTLISLREIMQDPLYSSASWKKQSVDVFYDNLTGLGDGFLYDEGVDPPRFAFNTGLETPEAQHIYCVMVPNDITSAIQPWRCEKFCYPGQNDPEGYGKWLCQKFGLPSENRDIMSASYESIENALDEIIPLQSSLLQQMNEAESCIRLGNPVPVTFVDQISRYFASWKAIQAAVSNLSINIPTAALTMDQIQDILNKKGSVSAVLDAMREDYLELVNGAWTYMDETVGALRYDPKPEADISRWDELMADVHLSENSINAAVQELMAPFCAMRTLLHCTPPLTEEQDQAWELLESHFDAIMRTRTFTRYFSDADDDQVVFLNKIDAIEKRRKQIKISSGAVINDTTASLDDREMIRQVLSSGNIHLIYSHYPALNEFEKAIVSGDHSQAQTIAQDSHRMADLGYSAEQQTFINLEIEKLSNNFSTPILTAGINLEKLQGNTNRQAEKYLLLAIALKDGDAVNSLADLLYREDRVDLLWEVYSANSHSFPVEIRQQYLPVLMEKGYLALSQIIHSDLLGFLAIQDPDAIDRFCCSSQLSDEKTQSLLKIRQAIQDPFIRQITFMDGELYRFIQHQENIESIQKHGIRHTQESLSELLKIGNFPRGQDTISVAQRLWHFIKDWNALAEAVILLAEDCRQKTDFLWNVYQVRNDQQRMLQLLRQDTTLQIRYREVYSDLLFTIGAYQEYFDVFAEMRDSSVRMQLQFAVCAIRIGQWDGCIPNIQDIFELANASDVIIALTRAMVETGLIAQLNEFLQTYFEPFMIHCSTETIEQIVTAGGTLDEEAILQLQNQAISDGHTALAMFCSSILRSQDDQYYDEAYYNRLWSTMCSAAPEEQAQSIRKMQLLFPEQYRRNYVRIFPYLLRSKLIVESNQLDETAPSVAQMLTAECISEDTIDQILNIMAEYGVLGHPLVQAKIMQLCVTSEYQDACLRIFHVHRDEFAGKLDRTLCILYQKALEESAIPQEFLIEAEAVCLRQLCNYQDPVAAKCLCNIEEKLGRDQFRQFVALQVKKLEDGDTSEYEEFATELSIFRQVLEDPDCSIDDYLRFCSSFGLFSEQDQQTVAALLAPDLEGALTEAESIPLLHGFYENRNNLLYLTAITRLPIRDNPEVYARLLFYCAQNAGNQGNLMQVCAEYCEKFQINDILIDALAEMIHKVNSAIDTNPRWHDAKVPFASVRNLYTTPDRFQTLSRPESVRDLLNEMCIFFRRIDANSAASEHHNSLRTIIELAVASHNEDMVADTLMDKLLGNYRKLGLVFAIHLLRRGNYDGALHQLRSLSHGFNQDVYPQLVGKLSRMSSEELAAWAEKEDARLLMEHFILPDGNRPDIQMLTKFAIKCICKKMQPAGIQVAEQLCEYFDKDSICHKVLFILCKDQYMDHLPQIQRALAGLYSSYPMDRRQYYTRTRDTILTLLTIVSAVMQQQNLPGIIDSHSDFIHRNTIADQSDLSRIVANQSILYDSVCSQFVGITDQERTLLTHCMLGCVTGNWSIFAESAFRAEITGEELASYLQNCSYSIYGLSRGFLRTAYSLSPEERDSFLLWVTSAGDYFGRTPSVLKENLKNIVLVLKQNKNPEVAQYVLQMPWEEHLVCLGDCKSSPEADTIDSCYSWMWNYLQDLPQGSSVTDALRLCYLLAQDDYKVTKLYQDAEYAFRQGEFMLAADIFGFFVDNYLHHIDLTRYTDEQVKKRAKARCKESYESRMRICKILQEDPDPETIRKFRNMKPHSCANIVISLIQSPHICELPRIMRYFQAPNQELCRGLLTVIDHRKTDAEKLAIYNSFESYPMAKHIIARILSTAGKDRTTYPFIQNPETGRKLGMTLAAQPDDVKFRLNRLLTMNIRLSESVLDQINALQLDEVVNVDDMDHLSLDANITPEQENYAAQKEAFTPAFVVQGSSADLDQQFTSLESLRQEYERCTYDKYEEKLKYARAIYFQVSKETPDNSVALSTALLQFGQEYRNYHLSRLSDSENVSDEEKHHSRILARQALLDMAYYTTLNRSSVDTIPIILNADGLRGILSNDFDSIDALMDDYRKNREGYLALSRYIGDKQIRDISGQIVREISRLEQHHNSAGPRDQNTSSYREAYKAAYDALEKLPFHLNWNQAKNTLLKLLMRAINNLDKRPFLDVRILNSPVATRSEFVTGTLSNTGRVPAETISIQAIFENDKTSDIYGIKELFPNEKICFDIPFTAPEGAATWSYTLNITYRHRDKEYAMDPFTGTLRLTDNNILPTDVDLYGAHKKMVFSTDEEGRIVSKGFYGRAAQIESLKRLAPEGAKFSEYNRAIVQGFRRTGKTSLLHYFEEYLTSKCADQAIPIYVDCEGFSSQPVQKAFVSSILHGVEFKLPHLAERDSWNRLKNSWMLSENAGDRNPDTLQFFYQALGRELEGKGVVLLLDEVDRLFGRLEETQGTASSLFPSLRAVQNNPACTAAVCMILCGSNNMLIYNQNMGQVYQLFQDFPKITVGRLNKEDIQNILTEPLEENGLIAYHPDAIEWIWRYTGGLVWYTKLLGNAAVKRVKEKGRKYIYPIDISHALDNVVQGKDTKQYIDEGCTEEAKQVLDAMAALSIRYGADITLNQLSALLDGSLSETQLDSSLALLTDTLGLLERSSSIRNAYHFAVEIYRRIYRNLDNYVYKRMEGPLDRTTITDLASEDTEGRKRKGSRK